MGCSNWTTAGLIIDIAVVVAGWEFAQWAIKPILDGTIGKWIDRL